MKRFFAFMFACATASLFLSGSMLVLRPHQLAPIYVDIDSDVDPSGVVNAIEALHRQDVQVVTMKRSESHDSPLVLFAGFTLLIMLVAGIVMFFYKLYCNLLSISSTL